MHEFSVARTLLHQAADICRDERGASVSQVRVIAGPLSGIEPDLLMLAFGQLTRDPQSELPELADAELVIRSEALAAECTVCECSFVVEDFNFRCPRCEGRVRVIQGDRLLLDSVSIEMN